LVLAATFSAGYIVSGLGTPDDNSADAGFARDMSLHHAQAVEMAMAAYQRGSTQDIRTLGYLIATTQQYQIGVMQTWLDDWHLSYTPPNGQMAWMNEGQSALLPDGRMPGMATNEDLNRLKGLSGTEFDVFFCQLMLRHHLGGIHMAEEAIALAKVDAVRELATQMRNAQSKEVITLTDKLEELKAKPLP
jgi:uncharacterized protein (DUF305 family)